MQVLSVITESLGKVKYEAIKHSPELFFTAGVVGVVTSTVLACRATLKAGEVIEKHNQMLDEIHHAAEVATKNNVYAIADIKRDTTLAYAKTIGKLTLLYLPSVIVGAGGIFCFGKSNGIRRDREMASAAVAASVGKAFADYRQRVTDKYGEEEEKKIRYNLKEETIETTQIDEKTGKEKTKKEKVFVSDGQGSMYARYITRSNPNYQNNDEFMRDWVELQARHLDDTLRARSERFLTLNEAYRAYDIPGCNDGIITGWKALKKTAGLAQIVRVSCTPVMIPNELGKLEKAYLLDFNVQGNIYEDADAS